jgi:lysophospholipase L1-like esterase
VPELSRRRLSTRRKLLFAATTLTVVLGLLEAGSRLLLDLGANVPWERHQRLVQVLGLPALNEILVPDPELFWKLRPGLRHYPLSGQIADSAPFAFSVSTDDRGLRPCPPGAAPQWRVVFVGDSCTFGLGVDDDQTFPALVQRRLAGVECVNLGVPGYSAYQGRLLLSRLALDRPPEVVVIAFGFNDDKAWDARGDLEHAKLLAASRSGLGRCLRCVELLARVLPRVRGTPAPATSGPRPRLTDPEFQAELRAMIGWCRQRNATPLLVLWPHRSQFADEGLFPKQAALLEVAESERVAVVDLLAACRVSGGADLFLDVIHANRRGCEAIADVLVPILEYVRRKPPDRNEQPTSAEG